MLADPQSRERRAASPRGVLIYAVAWLGTGALVAALVLVARPEHPSTQLPPVRQIQLERAARTAGCELRRGDAAARLIAPADGRAGRPASPGAYDAPLRPDALIAALRHGIVVIQYRAGISQDLLDRLSAVRSLVPRGTILAPSATAMPFEVAVSAWRRLMRCPRVRAATLDAVRLFRGRFLGSGPGG
jgi:hypothetical protein